MENGLLTLTVTGEEIRKLCEERIRRMAAHRERTVIKMREQLKFDAEARERNPHHYGIGAINESTIVMLEEASQRAASEVAFVRDHIDPSRSYEIYWRDLRDLFFGDDTLIGGGSMLRTPIGGCL